MTPRKTLLGVVALIALTVACTRPEITAITQPLAPPDAFAPSTTVTTKPRTTTTVDVERATIYPVDPITLEPIDGYEPIPVGDWYDWYWAAISSNDDWLALNVGSDDGGLTQVRLISLNDWETAATWDSAPYGSSLKVLDDGTVYSVTEGPSTQQLSRLSPGTQRPVAVAQLPLGSWWSGPYIDDRRAILFGLNAVDGDAEGGAAITTVDLETGAVIEIPLPGVELGTVAEVDIGEDYPGVVTANPAVVWDVERSRILIVHAVRDTVTEVDVVSGDVTEHSFGSEVWDWGPLFTGTAGEGGGAYVGNGRTAVLSSDGRSLFVATTSGDFVVTDAIWSAITTSTGIVTIDTETWQIVDRLDAPVSELHLSPDGARILATGYSDTQGINIYEFASSGLYVIDPSDLQVVAHHEPDSSDRSYGAFSFTRDSHLGYATSWGQQIRIDVIDPETGAIVATRTGESHIFGEVGVLADVVQGP